MKRAFLERSRQSSGFLILIVVAMLPRVVAAAFPSPTNDDFFGRIQIGPGNIHTNGTMLGASQENGEWGGLFGLKSVWWAWNATNSGPVTVSVEAEVNDGEVSFPWLSIEVSTGDSLVQLAPVAAGSSDVRYDGRLAPSVTFEAVSGQRYVIGLNGRQEVGDYTLEVVQGLPPTVMVETPHAGTVFK